MKHLFLLLSLLALTAVGQTLTPVTRFRAADSPYAPYFDQFLSGFMQRAGDDARTDGILQTPFVDTPLLIYVGEKDSTQYMAYASGYTFDQREPALGRYGVTLHRYGVHATLTAHPAYVESVYTFPDTTALKGVLFDLDHATRGASADDMDVVFVDKHTVRAYKRGAQNGAQGKDLYFVAHFSHPFTAWNVRRETVTLADGTKEPRVKAAFMFDLAPDDSLVVRSALSALGTAQAMTALGIKAGRNNVDQRPAKKQSKPASAQSSKKDASTRSTNCKTLSTPSLPLERGLGGEAGALRGEAGSFAASSFISVTTSSAPHRAAFAAALARVSALPVAKGAADAAALLRALRPLYPATSDALDAAQTDSLLTARTQALFAGGERLTDADAVWFVFNALGLVPCPDGDGYRLVRPVFNVATLTLSRGRRFIIHTKNNTARALRVRSAALSGTPLDTAAPVVTHEQLARGGVLEVRMSR